MVPTVLDADQVNVAPDGIPAVKSRLVDAPSQIISVLAVPAGVGFTVTCCDTVEVFPFTSVTVHTTVVVPKANVAGALLVMVPTPQLSVAVAVPVVTAIPDVRLHTVTSAGAVATGASASVTTTLCEQVDVVPAKSVAVHTTVVVPTAYGPAGTGPDTVTVEHGALAVAIPMDALDVQIPASAVIFAVAGHVMVGACTSLTITV
jgi:hypothetical protein